MDFHHMFLTVREVSIRLLMYQFVCSLITKSSLTCSLHLLTGTPYDDNTWLLGLKHVLEFFRFVKFTILGHSMGASIGWMFASIYPDLVQRIIAIDQIKPATVANAVEAAESINKQMTSYIEAEKKYKSPQPTFRFETALDILIIAHDAFGVKLNREGALCLMKRATKTAADGSGLIFTRDARLNALLGQKADTKTLREFYTRMKCEMLIILGKDGINDLTRPDIKSVYEGYRETIKNFKCITIPGDHFIHLSQPEKVAEIIVNYVSTDDLIKKTAGLSV